MSKQIVLENWSAVDNSWGGYQRDPYKHEFARLEVGSCLQGKSFGHPRITDGHRVLTSQIRTINGNIITTMSESIYKLGTMNPNFQEPFSNDISFIPED